MTEFHRHGIDSRIGKHRADVHQTMDPIIVAGPWLLGGVWFPRREIPQQIGPVES